MPSDFEIGRVVAVSTAQVTVELSREFNALTRTTYEGPQEVGRVNSYVVMPVGAQRLVAMITQVMLLEEQASQPDRAMVALPSARRLLKATLIGTIGFRSFTQGVSSFPVLHNPVHLATEDDLNVMFDTGRDRAGELPDPERPGYCIHLGESTVFEGYPVRIDPDAFFGKHAAVLGSTGSGKSCTVASLLQSILAHPEIHQTNFVILDTNGEYRSAFQTEDPNGVWQDNGTRKCLYIPSDPLDSSNRLAIPYWFLNTDDMVRLFRASQGVQRPVLMEAVRLARNESTHRPLVELLREELILEFNRLWSLSGKEEKISKDLRDLAKGLLSRLDAAEYQSAWTELQGLDLTKSEVSGAVRAVMETAERHVDGAFPKPIPANARAQIRQALDPIFARLTGVTLGQTRVQTGVSADSPAHFDKIRFRNRHIEQVLRREESGGARARDFAGTMLLRIDRVLADKRFEFLMGPPGAQLPSVKHSLATFLRDLIGLKSCDSSDSSSRALTPAESVPDGQLPFYDRQRRGSLGHNVVVVDLSLLAAEVLENVTALIGRLVLEFLQRLGEFRSPSTRGSLPVVLVLEEAQNYIAETSRTEDLSVSRQVFERIAREGRKHGLGLVLSSQRPSELSKTILSQCSSFIVHRLQNPEDLAYFRQIVPAIYGDLLGQLPALSPQTALVLGECVRAPALVRIREAMPLPRSRDPRFYKHWVDPRPREVPIEDVCMRWEGNVDTTAQQPGAPPR